MSNSALVAGLREIGLDAYAEPTVSGFGIKRFPVSAGRHAGDTIDIAVAIDFPLTPPAGVHMRATYGTVGVNDGKNNVLASPMGAGWQYFSRRYERWNGRCNARSVLAFINRVMLDA